MRVNKSEIEGYKDEISYLKERIDKHIENKCDLETKVVEKNSEISSLEMRLKSAQSMIDSLKKENELLRKYYSLDEEPSDEVKMKIHIDLEINRLKEEKMMLMALRQIPYIPQFVNPYNAYNMLNSHI